MRHIFRYTSTLVAILGAHAVDFAITLFTAAIGKKEEEDATIAAEGQILAAVVFQRRGLPGLKSLLKEGLISRSLMLAYIAREWSYREIPASEDAVAALAAPGLIEGLTFDLSGACSDPLAIRKIVAYVGQQV